MCDYLEAYSLGLYPIKIDNGALQAKVVSITFNNKGIKYAKKQRSNKS
jgi:hypothetical protein